MTAPAFDIAGEAGALVKDLHRARPRIYWTDLSLSVIAGWGAFAAALLLPLRFAPVFALIAILALYRALCFIHEISHQSPRTLPRFAAFWNLTTGFPLLLPSCMYAGVHSNHHRLSTYGTENDPEYLPFARSARMTFAFAAESLLLPGVLAVRFLLLAPVSFFLPRFERWLASRFSALSMNVDYRREVTPETLRMIRRQSAGILLLWAPMAIFLPARFFALLYCVSACISVLNGLRTLGAHAYRSDGHPLTREAQMRDSIDTPAPQWGVFWAPVGLRFHALHHYFPGIPYHNLSEAYRRLASQLPAEAGIHAVRSPGLGHSLAALWRSGIRRKG